MKRYFLTPEARNDLVSIYRHIATENQRAATAHNAKLRKKMDLVAENPLIGRTRESLAPRLRSIAVGAYLIFYRQTRGSVEIIRVLHGARDLEEIFLSMEDDVSVEDRH